MTSVSNELSQRISGLINRYKTSSGVYGFVWNPEDHNIYLDNPSKKTCEYRDPVMNATAWAKANNILTNDEKGKAASELVGDPREFEDAFYGPWVELADHWDRDMNEAQRNQDKGLAGSIITSQDYSILVQPVALGESIEAIPAGVLSGFFGDIPTPQLKGDWLDFTSGVEYFTNVPEGLLPEPTKGLGTAISIEVPKHAGGVGQTERSEMILSGAGRNIYQTLVQALARKRLQKENGLVANELENATTVIAGVDFGLRAGSPPASSNVPNDFWQTVIDSFAGAGGNLNGAASKNLVFNEYKNNDYNKGFQTTTSNVSGPDASGPAPGVDGVTWFRDNAIVSATKMWVADRDKAGKNFRGPVRSFDISSERTESKETYLKSYLLVKLVDQDFIREVTGVSA